MALVIGIILIAFCVFACLPAGIGFAWGADIVSFLKGFVPVLSAFLGILAIFIGIADIQDKKAAKKEEKLSKTLEEK